MTTPPFQVTRGFAYGRPVAVVAQLLVIAGFPTDINERYAATFAAEGLPPYQPGVDYSIVKCTEPTCGTDMWIGPEQLAKVKDPNLNTDLVCVTCCCRKGYVHGPVVGLSEVDSPRRNTTR